MSKETQTALLEKLQSFARECDWWSLVGDCNSAMDGDKAALKECFEIIHLIGLSL